MLRQTAALIIGSFFLLGAVAAELTPGQQQFVKGAMAADIDGDGRLSEAEAGLGFATMDQDRSGYVEVPELQAFARQFLRPFAWVNQIPADQDLPPGTKHGTFLSPSMNHAVGYVVYLPPGYEDRANAERRYPTVYYLHGGRPGNETRSIALTQQIHAAMVSKSVPPAIYVFANGGKVSHYNVPGSMGEDLFIKELVPHIDANYRTIAHAAARGLEGFSQGGRGTTRIAFKYPQLFASVAAGGPGYAMERSIYENDGVEQDQRAAGSQRYEFGKGNDAYTQAIAFAEHQGAKPDLAIWIGTSGFNYTATLEYLGFLYALGIEPRRFVAEGVGHNPIHLYQEFGIDLMCFHAASFAKKANLEGCAHEP